MKDKIGCQVVKECSVIDKGVNKKNVDKVTNHFSVQYWFWQPFLVREAGSEVSGTALVT